MKQWAEFPTVKTQQAAPDKTAFFYIPKINHKMETLITNNRTLKMLNDAELIVWPVMVNNSKGIKFKYVDNGKDNLDAFTHNGINYILKYHSGCFFPYLYRIS